MGMKMWMAAGVLLCLSGAGQAQQSMHDGPAASAEAMTEPAKAEDAMLSAFEEEFTGVAKAMPADKYSFAPSAAVFASGSKEKFDGVRTFAGEITHVIQANYYFYSLISGTKPDADMKSLSTLTSKDQILPALAASFAFAHKAVATITPENAFETIKGADGMNTRATLASFGVAHGFDHFGQMAEYLRMNGVLPPGSK